MRILRFLIKATCIFILALVMLASLLVVLSQTKVLGNLPLVSEYQPLVVLSGSMEPTLKVGSVVVIGKVNPGLIKEGDIITFSKPVDMSSNQPEQNTMVTHRVSRVLDQNGIRKFETKGDANNDIDASTITEGEIVGKASFDVPYLGYVSHYLRGKVGLLVLICVAVGVILFEAGTIIVRVWGGRYSSSY